MNKTISIIIPVYNAEKFILRCLNSIAIQSYKNYEIIIVDDGSLDNSLSVCKAFKNSHENITINIFSQKNCGPSKARNLGLDNAKGEFIMFVDADDYISDNVLENMVKNISSNVFVKINYKTINNEKIISHNNIFGFIESQSFIEKILANKYNGFVIGGLFERKVIGNNRFLNNIYFLEDTVFLIEYLLKIKKVKFVEGYYYYCLNSDSITISNDKIIDNITSFCKALTSINNTLNGKYYKEVENKKIILIEKELSKLDNYFMLKKTIKDNDFKNLLNQINEKMIFNPLYRFLLRRYKNENILMIYIYIKIRNFLKIIKNFWRKNEIINNNTDIQC